MTPLATNANRAGQVMAGDEPAAERREPAEVVLTVTAAGISGAGPGPPGQAEFHARPGRRHDAGPLVLYPDS